MKPLNKVLQIFGVVTNLKNLKCLFKMILQNLSFDPYYEY